MKVSVLRAYSAGILTAVGFLWLASGVEREHTVLGLGLAPAQQTEAVAALEADVSAHPENARARRDLAQAYLDARAPGLALSLIEASPDGIRHQAIIDHVYARALIDEGRSADALVAEQRVLAVCDADDAIASHDCQTWLLVSATRRVDILEQLVSLGIEDAQAHPEASAVAYANATREARLALQ
ncbi:MAG: hypothetical protein ABI461_04700 [Polyangiaceae bacterium]